MNRRIQNKFARNLIMVLFLLVCLPLTVMAENYNVGVWYGDNNLTNFDNSQANANGGSVQYNKTWGDNQGWKNMANRDNNAITPSEGADRTFKVIPDTANSYQIKFIKYATASGDFENGTYEHPPSSTSWTSVAVSTPTAETQFTISNIRAHYIIWVVFEKTGTSASYTVTASVLQLVATDANSVCNTSTINVTGQNPSATNPQVAIKTGVPSGGTASFSYTPAQGCEVDSVQFGSGAYVAYASNTYVTQAINSDTLVSVKFRKVSLVVTSAIDASSPTGSGTINPLGNTPVAKNGSQSYTITPTTGHRIVKVIVTDTNAGYANADLGPITTYTFSNVTVNGSITVYFAVEAATTCTYCLIPPFVSGQSSLTPNVLIVFDNSGSMDWKSYQINNATYSDTTNYYGYFDTSKMYKLNSTTKTYTIDTTAGLNKTTSCTNATTVACSGNRLNFDRMAKVDVIRKVLTGGKTVDRTAATKYLMLRDGYKVEYGTSEPTGIIQSLAGKVSFGLMVINGTHTGELVTKLGEPSATLVTAIEGSKTDPSGSTPLAHTLYEAVRYFEAKPSAYGSIDYGTIDPVQYACQKHFVLILTDGQPNSNDNLPGAGTLSDLALSPDTFDVTTWISRITATDKTNVDADGQKTAAVAYYAHNTDLRSSKVGKTDILGVQNLTFYTVFAFGEDKVGAPATLKAVSKYGAYENTNANGSLTYASPDLTKEWDKDGNGVPDTYFEADQGDTLKTNIETAMSSILAKVASGTAASILSNSEGSGANLLQAVFYPNKIFSDGTQVDWIGEMQNLWYYVDPFIQNSSIREDTDFESPAANPTTPYHVMDLKKDYALRFYFANSETSVEVKQDTNGDGAGDTVIAAKESPDDVKSIFRAGKLLWARDPESTTTPRTIHTSIDGYSLLNPTVDAKGGFASATTRATALQPYLQAADVTEAQKIISYIRGTDQTGYRTRKVALTTGGTQKEWKLGDIVSSTPRIQATGKLNAYNVDSPVGYGDKSYEAFINTAAYKARGMVYVGVNDGMLHAFKLGKLTVKGTTDVPTSPSGYLSVAGDVKATLTGTNLGEEQWAYIPRSVLPYLKYFTDNVDYKHLFYVDGPTVLVDASIAKPSWCTSLSTDYSGCPKANPSTGVYDGSNWKTLLIGSMGLGGASRASNATCTASVASGTCVKTPIADPTDTAATKTKMVGYSSYFALDITDQYFNSTGALASQPTLKWEFPPPGSADDFGLGFSTSGAAIVRISARITDPNDSTKQVPDQTKNGKWFAVFASGPTGPIETVSHQFIGKSDQNLKLFVVDLGATMPLVKDTNYWVIDTGIKRAFGGSIVNGAVDVDRWNKSKEGNYQDDVVYVGYVKANISDSAALDASTAWTDGGVIRLLTKEDPNPANWAVSTVISGVGPVANGISRLQDRKNNKMWLYFGTGRFYYGGDDPASQRYILGVQDACYTGVTSTMDKNCSVSALSGFTDLENQTSTVSTTLATGKKGWYIALDGQDTSTNMGAERSITDAVALTNGLVMFTTFKPTSDVCSFGGSSYLWGVKYDTGGAAPSQVKDTAKVLVQVSTGAFEEVNLGTALTASSNRKMATPMTGKPPSDPPPIISNASNKPPKKILHMQEK